MTIKQKLFIAPGPGYRDFDETYKKNFFLNKKNNNNNYIKHTLFSN